MKKKHIVVPRLPHAMKNGLQTSRGKLSFKGKTAMWVDDDLASEIDTQHGERGSNDVWVMEDPTYNFHRKHDSMTDGKNYGIHHYTFAGVDTSRLRTTKDNGYVWARKDGKQIRLRRVDAMALGYEIVEPKKRLRRKAKETTWTS